MGVAAGLQGFRFYLDGGERTGGENSVLAIRGCQINR